MRYALRRAGQAAIVLIAAFTATFILLQLLPGDAILIKFDNPELGLTPEQIADPGAYGADVPWWEQYLHTLAGYAQGDFGYSTQYGTGVLELIGEALPRPRRSPGLASSPPCYRLAIAFVSTLTPFAWLRERSGRCPECSSRCRCSGSASC